MFFLFVNLTFAQKYLFIHSDKISENIPEVQKAEAEIINCVELWKSELEDFDNAIQLLDKKIEKFSSLWQSKELSDLKKQLIDLEEEKNKRAQEIFGSDGEYDKLVKQIWQPIEKEIFDKVVKDSIFKE